LSCGFFYLLFLFPCLISSVGDWMSTIRHTWCGLSANLECKSEMCCTQLAGYAGRKKSPSGHHPTTLSGYIFATTAHIDNGKKNLLSSNISCTSHYNMVNFGILVASLVWGTPANFNGFSSWQRYCTALQYWASAKLCAVEQRAPTIFGRAAITLGIGPYL